MHTVVAHRYVIGELEHFSGLALRTAAHKADVLVVAFFLFALTGLFVHWLFGLSVRIFQLLLILFIKIRHIFPHFRYMISVSRFSIHSGSFRFALSMPPNNFRLTLSCLPAAPGSLSIYTILRTERISL